MRKDFCRLLVSSAVLALMAMAGVGYSGLGARAAQVPAPAQPATTLQETPPAPEQSPVLAPQPAAAGEATPETPPDAAPKADANAAQAADDGGNQVAADCARLLKMATDLKAEVDKTTKEELSVSVVRKAGEIEQLARKVRKK